MCPLKTSGNITRKWWLNKNGEAAAKSAF